MIPLGIDDLVLEKSCDVLLFGVFRGGRVCLNITSGVSIRLEWPGA